MLKNKKTKALHAFVGVSTISPKFTKSKQQKNEIYPKSRPFLRSTSRTRSRAADTRSALENLTLLVDSMCCKGDSGRQARGGGQRHNQRRGKAGAPEC